MQTHLREMSITKQTSPTSSALMIPAFSFFHFLDLLNNLLFSIYVLFIFYCWMLSTCRLWKIRFFFTSVKMIPSESIFLNIIRDLCIYTLSLGYDLTIRTTIFLYLSWPIQDVRKTIPALYRCKNKTKQGYFEEFFHIIEHNFDNELLPKLF